MYGNNNSAMRRPALITTVIILFTTQTHSHVIILYAGSEDFRVSIQTPRDYGLGRHASYLTAAAGLVLW